MSKFDQYGMSEYYWWAPFRTAAYQYACTQLDATEASYGRFTKEMMHRFRLEFYQCYSRYLYAVPSKDIVKFRDPEMLEREIGSEQKALWIRYREQADLKHVERQAKAAARIRQLDKELAERCEKMRVQQLDPVYRSNQMLMHELGMAIEDDVRVTHNRETLQQLLDLYCRATSIKDAPEGMKNLIYQLRNKMNRINERLLK